MADYNPSAPEIIGQEWVPIRNELLRFMTASTTFERGYSFSTEPWNTDFNAASFYIDQPSDDRLVQNKTHTINVYPKGRETETGPVRRLLIEPNWYTWCKRDGGVTTCNTSDGSESAGPAALYSAGDTGTAYVRGLIGNSGYQQAEIGFAVNKYKNQLNKKRILGVNILINTNFSWAGPTNNAPQTSVNKVLYNYYIGVALEADGDTPTVDETHALGQQLGLIAGIDVPRYMSKLQRFVLGNVNLFYGATATPPLPLDIREWDFNGLAKFDLNRTTTAVRVQIYQGQNNFVPQENPLLDLNYVRLEVLYCDETRIATGTRLQSQRFIYGGPNAVNMYRIFDTTSPAPVNGDLTVTLCGGTLGWDAAWEQEADHYLNQVRQLEPIDGIQGVQINLPFPMDDSAEGLYLTSESTNLIPQITLSKYTNPATDTPGVPLTWSHAYGKSAPIAAAPLQALQGVYNPLPSYVTGTKFKYARFYARHVTPTADTNSELRLTTRLSMPDLDTSPLLYGFDDNTLSGWTPSDGTFVTSSARQLTNGYSGKFTYTDAMPNLADRFERNVASGWGTPSPIGPVYTSVDVTGGTPSVSGTVGRMALSTVNKFIDVEMSSTSLTDVHVVARGVRPASTPVGAAVQSSFFARVNGPFTTWTGIVVTWNTDGTATARISTSAGSLTGEIPIPGVTSSQSIDFSMTLVGSAVKGWAAPSTVGLNEAATPLLTGTTSVLTAGTVDFEAYSEPGATLPLFIFWDDVWVGPVASQPQGAAVSPQIPILPNQEYYFSYWVMTDSAPATGNAYAQVAILDSGGNLLETWNGSQAKATSTWAPRAVIVNPTSPRAAFAVLRAVLDFVPTNESIYVDQAQFNIVRVIEDVFRRDRTQVVADNFKRTSSPGWGTSDDGRAWVTSLGTGSASNVFINSGQPASINMTAASQEYFVTAMPFGSPASTAHNVAETLVTISGTRADFGLVLRWLDVDNHYRLNVSVNTASGITMTIVKEVATVTTTLATASLAGSNLATSYIVRFEVIGSVLKGWLSPATNPTTPLLYAAGTDAVFTAGRVGVRTASPAVSGRCDFSYFTCTKMFQSWFGQTTSGHMWDASTYAGLNSGVTWNAEVAKTYLSDYDSTGYNPHAAIVGLAANSFGFGPYMWMSWANVDVRVTLTLPDALGAGYETGLMLVPLADNGLTRFQAGIEMRTGSLAVVNLHYFDGAADHVLGTSGQVFNTATGGRVFTVRMHYEEGELRVKAWQETNSARAEPSSWDISYVTYQAPFGSPPRTDTRFTISSYITVFNGNSNPYPLVAQFSRFLAYSVDSYLTTDYFGQRLTSPEYTASAAINIKELDALDPVVDSWREVTLELDQEISLGDEGSLTFIGLSTNGYDSRWEVISASSPALSGTTINGVAPALNIFNQVAPPYQLTGYGLHNQIDWYRSSEASRDTQVALNDQFHRSASTGWGTADTGETWSITAGSSSNFHVGYFDPSFSTTVAIPTGYIHGPSASQQTATVTPDSQNIWPQSECFTYISIPQTISAGDIVRAQFTWPGPLGAGAVSMILEKRDTQNWYVRAKTSAGQDQNPVLVPSLQGSKTIVAYGYVINNEIRISVDSSDGSQLKNLVHTTLLLPISNPVSGTPAATASVTLDTTSAANAYDLLVYGLRLGHTVFVANGANSYDAVTKRGYAAASWTPQLGPTFPVPYNDAYNSPTDPIALYEDKNSAISVIFAPKLPAVTGVSATVQTQLLTPVTATCSPGITAPTHLLYNRITWPTNQQVLLDSFSRSVSGGWGQSSDYPAWQTIGASAYSWTEPGFGHLVVTPSIISSGQRIQLDSWNCDLRFTVDATPGSDVVAIPQNQGGLDVLQLRFSFRDTTEVSISAAKDIELGVFTVYVDSGIYVNSSDYPVPFLAPASTTQPVSYSDSTNVPATTPGYLNNYLTLPMHVRARLYNTELRVKLWSVGTNEPDFWAIITYLPNMAGPQEKTAVTLVVDSAGGNFTADVKYSDISITDGRSTSIEIQRQDDIDTVWATILKTDNPFINYFNDYEARIGVPTRYRVRRVAKGDFPGSWSQTLTSTIVSPGISGTTGHVLTFTSNENQDGSSTLAYCNSWEGVPVAEPYNFPEAGFTQLQLMYGKDFYTAFRPLERGGEQFTRDIVVQAAAVSQRTIDNFRSLRDLAWDSLPYVCVRDENGNRWFANIQVPSGNVRFYRTLYQASVQVTEVTNTPVPVNPIKPWESA